MRRDWIFAGLLTLLVGLTTTTSASAQDPAIGNLSGHWDLTVRFDDTEVCHGPMTLEQHGAVLHGTYTELDQRSSHAGKTGKLDGKIDGTRVVLTLTFADGYTASWKGTASPTTIRGTLSTNKNDPLVWTWTAERAPAAKAAT